ncbi:hypothetical protein CLOL250_00530 [Clostridium sp. L2-50]|nr:hypothetical protein CLOL250_00530 [Clostridium sp. L2-50]
MTYCVNDKLIRSCIKVAGIPVNNTDADVNPQKYE